MIDTLLDVAGAVFVVVLFGILAAFIGLLIWQLIDDLKDR